MLRGLSDAEMAKEAAEAGEPISADSIANVRRLVRLSMDDKLVPAPSDAEGQAGLYRELLNYRRSPELTQHIKTKLAKLQELDPKILLTPLGHVHLGANDPRSQRSRKKFVLTAIWCMQESAHEHQTRRYPSSPPVSPTRRGLSGIRRRGHSISELLGKHATPLQSQEPGAQGRNMPALPAIAPQYGSSQNLREKRKADRRTEKEYDAKRNPIRVVQGGLGSGDK